jgi:hypothetical protein
MPPESLASLRKQLNEIIAEEIRFCLRKGRTDLQTVAALVKKRASRVIKRLQKPLAEAEVVAMVGRALKRVNSKEGEDEDRQLVFAGMGEFSGVPYNIAFSLDAEDDDEPKVIYTPYLDSLEADRAAALELLGRSIQADEHKYHALKSANAFASSLVALYGDLPLGQLYKLHKEQKAHA